MRWKAHAHPRSVSPDSVVLQRQLDVQFLDSVQSDPLNMELPLVAQIRERFAGIS